MGTKKIHILLAALWGLVSCVGELHDSAVTAQEGLNLNFSCVERLTKATDMPGTEKENRLQTIYYYMFTENATNDTPAVYHSSFSPNRTDGRASVNIPLNPTEIEKLFPGNVRTCKIFAVANFNPDLGNNPTLNQLLNCEVSTAFEDVLDPESFVMVSSDQNGNAETSTIRLISKNNTTAATGDVLLNRLAVKISLSLHVEADAVISNTIDINGSPVERFEIWEPQWKPGADGTGGAQFYMMHGAGSSKLSAVPYINDGDKDVAVLFDYSSGSRRLNGVTWPDTDYMTYGYKRDEASGKILFDASGKPEQLISPVAAKGEFCQVEPFYSYPQTWQYGYTYEPYIKLVIPWKRLAGKNPDGSGYQELTKAYYYKVICAGSKLDARQAVLGSNYWYEIFLNVGILGSETDEAETEIEGRFVIAEWQKKNAGGEGEGEGSNNNIDKETEIIGARYLSIPEEKYILYNQNELKIPVTTSHECELSDTITVWHTDYFKNTVDTVYITEKSPWNRNGYSLDIEGNHIVFNNPLLNYGVDDNYDVDTYNFNFTIYHADDSSYVRNITIEQHPSIMITSYINSEASENGSYSNANKGWVFVNNNTDQNNNWGGVPGLISNASNKNPNMYIIETTVLAASTNFLIGDPRTRTIDNINNGTWSAQAAGIEGGPNRRLTYYRPVDPDISADNVIAPKFRIASSFGVSYTLGTRTVANQRCASYQEDGYPAGRWRVPTRAEIKYMAQLTTDGMIPRLLGALGNENNNTVTYYWCNSGSVGVYGGSSTQDPVDRWEESGYGESVRCVYDEWYWSVVDKNKGYTVPFPDEGSGIIPDKGTFRWGDEAF